MLAIFSRIKSKFWFLKSIRVHEILAITLVGIIPILLFSLVLVNTYIDRANEQMKNDLRSQGNSLANSISDSGYLKEPANDEVDMKISQIAAILEGRILVVDSNLNIIKDTYGIEDGKTLISKEVIECLKGAAGIDRREKGSYYEMLIPITHNATKEIMGVIVMSFSAQNIYTMAKVLSQKASILMVTAAILILVFAIVYSGFLTRPLLNLKQAIGHLTEGYMDDEVTIGGFHEIKQISNSLNQMLLRMKNLERSRQEFVSNVSHELKTPLTSVKVLADSLLMQDNTPPELYREFLVDIAEEIERESKIINDLLSLVKLDKAASDMNIVSMNINELLELVLKRLRPIAQKRNIELVFESFRPVVAEVDEVKFSLAISNLIENAIKYNIEDGWVRVSLNADHKYFYVKVADSGIGIPEDAQDFIFDRFYRVDKARSRGTGGTGLGLSITKNAVHMHKGAIKVYSKENEGTTFTVRIPINYIA